MAKLIFLTKIVEWPREAESIEKKVTHFEVYYTAKNTLYLAVR